MAAHISGIPRPMTSGSLPQMHLPVIEHPMSRMGDHASLSIHGEMTPLGTTAREQNCFTLGDDGKLHLGLDHASLPPLGFRGGSASTVMFGSNSDMIVRNLSDKGKYRRPVENTPRVGIDELEFMLSDKIAMEPHGIRHLFKMNDPSGHGAVTREALLKILYSLVGYISNDHFTKLLKRMGLDNKTQVTYEDMASYFTYEENSQKAWLDPINQKVDIQKKNIEDHLRRSPTFLLHDKYLTASTCHMLLKDRIQKRIKLSGVSMCTLFPDLCKDDNTLVLPMHLLEVLKDLDIPVREDVFAKLWQRYDKEGVGGLRQKHLFKILGLDKDGFLSTAPTPRNIMLNTRSKTFIETPMKRTGLPREEKKENVTKSHNKTDATPSDEPKNICNNKHSTNKKSSKRLENVIEMLHYKFEEAYLSLQKGLQCFDFLQDGYITKIDLKKVLDEFGLSMLAMDIDPFLSRMGLKVLRNQVPYKELLDKYWNRGEGGMANRIAKNNKYFFLNDGYHSYGDHLTPEQLEAKLLEFFHKEYFLMAEHLSSADRYKLGVVTKHEFHDAVQKALGYVISDTQWDNLLNTIQPDADGLIPYTKFLEQFCTVKPGQWKKEYSAPQALKYETQLAVYHLQDLSAEEARKRQPELDKLKKESSEIISIELKQKVARNIHILQQEKHGRPLNQLNSVIQDLFQKRFFAVDSAFKSSDRRMTGRVSKQQFLDILKLCDLELLPLEIDRLWHSLDISADGMITFTSLVHHFKNSTMKNSLAPSKGDNGNDDHLTSEQKDISDIHVEFVKKRPLHTSEMSNKANILAEIMERIKPVVHEHWAHLKEILSHADQHGQGFILGMDMKDILKTLRMPLTDVELHKLLAVYDKKRDGHFHYLDFLNHYAIRMEHGSRRPWDQNFITDFKHLLQKKEVVEDRTYFEIMERIRQDLNRPPLVKEHKSIKRAFKKADLNGEGVLSVTEFRDLLKSCNIKVDAEDFYHIISQFDENMDGKISYSQFLAQVIG